MTISLIRRLTNPLKQPRKVREEERILLQRRLLRRPQMQEEEQPGEMEVEVELMGQVLMREGQGTLEEVEVVVVGIDVLPSFLLFWFSGLSVSTTMTNLLMTSYENDNYLQPF